MAAKKRQPSAEEMLRWLVQTGSDIYYRDGLWTVTCWHEDREEWRTDYKRGNLRAAIRAAMKAERGKHGS